MQLQKNLLRKFQISHFFSYDSTESRHNFEFGLLNFGWLLEILKSLVLHFFLLCRSDATCIICREEMTNAKKLICGHLFHVHCLRSWLERQQTCPTCRALVVPPENATSAAAGQRGLHQGSQQGKHIAAHANLLENRNLIIHNICLLLRILILEFETLSEFSLYVHKTN